MLKKIAQALVAYPACWVVAHCAVMLSRGDGLSLDYLLPYFKSAWSFSAGELPSFIWLVSLVFYVLLYPDGRQSRGGAAQVLPNNSFKPTPLRGAA